MRTGRDAHHPIGMKSEFSASKPNSCVRPAASLREEIPSFRYADCGSTLRRHRGGPFD
jgi:hypothetical protein